MSFTYKDAKQYQRLDDAYIKAAELNPNNLEINTALFYMYAKKSNYVKQQQVSLKLSKLDPSKADALYSWWTVCSLVLQARSAVQNTPHGTANAASATQFMKLAESMAIRLIQKHGGVPTYECLLLIFDIFCAQQKKQELLDIIQSKASKLKDLLEDDKKHVLAAAHALCGDVSLAGDMFKCMSIDSPDDWLTWSLYLDCMLPETIQAPSPHCSDGVNTIPLNFPVCIPGGLVQSIMQGKQQADVSDVETIPHAISIDNENSCSGTLSERIKEIDSALDTITHACVIDKEQDARQRNCKNRGALMISLEVAYRKQKLYLPGADQDAVAAVCHSLDTLLSMSSCVPDLRKYLQQFDGKKGAQEVVVQDILAACAAAQESYESAGAMVGSNESLMKKERLRAVQRAVNCQLLLKEITPPISYYYDQKKKSSPDGNASPSSHDLDTVLPLIQLYEKVLPYRLELDPKDRTFGEDLIALLAHQLIETSMLEMNRGRGGGGGDGHNNAQNSMHDDDGVRQEICVNAQGLCALLSALLAMEAAQVKSSVAAPLRLSCCAVYGLLGAPNKAAEQFSKLDIKGIMLDSLASHFLIPALIAGSMDGSSILSKLFSGVDTLHTKQLHEAKEALATAYEQKTYSKVIEIVDFIDKLTQSHTKYLFQAEKVIEQLRLTANPSSLHGEAVRAGTPESEHATTAVSSASDSAAVKYTNIRFNEDLSCRPAWYFVPCAEPRCAVVSWWEESRSFFSSNHAASHCPAGYWWRSGCLTAEREDTQSMSDVHAWKRKQHDGICRRKHLPSVLACLLDHQEVGIIDRLHDIEKIVQDGWPDHGHSAVDILNAACRSLFLAGINLKKYLVHHAAGGDVRPHSNVLQSIAVASSKLRAAWDHARSRVLHGNETTTGRAHLLCAVMNGGLSFASLFLSEEAFWAASCYSAWIALLNSPLEKTRAEDSREELKEIKEKKELLDALHVAAAALHDGIEALNTALSGLFAENQAMELLELITKEWPRASELWSYCDFDAMSVLKALCDDQEDTVKRMQGSAEKILVILKKMKL